MSPRSSATSRPRAAAGAVRRRRARLDRDRARRLARRRVAGPAPARRPVVKGRDSSRLLASASLAVQHAYGVVAEPMLLTPGPSSWCSAAEAALVIAGLSDHWQQEGLGEARGALAQPATIPCCSSAAGCARAVSHRAKASPDSHGRSDHLSLRERISVMSVSGLRAGDRSGLP